MLMWQRFLNGTILCLATIMLLCIPISKLYAQNYALPLGKDIGTIAPQIALPNAAGDSLFLYDYRGSVVLLDFWASWCGTCRIENKQLARIYATYKDSNFVAGRGFTIFSLSIDTNPTAWQRAIENDQLAWHTHVIDTRAFYSPYVTLYAVSGIPHTLLIDKHGKIIAKNIRAKDLERFLQSLLLK